MKKRMLAVCLAVMLALGACGDKAAPAGLLSEKEIERYESLYLTGSDGALEKLGIAEGDIDTGMESYETLSSVGTYPLKETRNIEGVEFTQFVNISIVSEPYGFYGVRFTANFMESEEASKALRAIYAKTVELYGEPGADGFSREQLYDPQHGSAAWRAGELTELSMVLYRLEDAANFDPSWEYRYSLDIVYGIPKTVDGRLLAGEEMLDMVRRAQEKQ